MFLFVMWAMFVFTILVLGLLTYEYCNIHKETSVIYSVSLFNKFIGYVERCQTQSVRITGTVHEHDVEIRISDNTTNESITYKVDFSFVPLYDECPSHLTDLIRTLHYYVLHQPEFESIRNQILQKRKEFDVGVRI